MAWIWQSRPSELGQFKFWKRLNQIVNDVFRAYGLEPASLQWNFFHAYSENIGHIEPADWLKKAYEVAEQKGHEETE